MKKVLSVFLSTMILFTAFFNGALTASAAEEGTLPSNAIVLSEGNWRTKCWTEYNYDLNCYNKITVPERGYITISLSKPFDDEGEMCSYKLALFTPSGENIWDCNTEPQTNSFNEYFVYKVGLDSGTYFLNIIPDFEVVEGIIETQHKYEFTANSYWEIEPNNDMSSATELKLDKVYTGVYADESFDTSYRDYYKVKLIKGKKYRFTVGQYNELEAGTTIFEIINSSGKELTSYDVMGDDYEGKEQGNGRYWDITAKSSGYHYMLFRNDAYNVGTEYTVCVKQLGGKAPNTKTPASKLNIKLSTKSYTYDGKAKKPSVIVKNSNGTKVSSSYYTVKYASGRKNIGKYKVTITFKGNYSGTKTLYFKINPKKVKSLKVKSSKKKQLTISWKKDSKVTGYEIAYATNKKFTKNKKTVTVKSAKTVKKTIKSLKSKKTYYVKVRSYKTVGGKKYYSAYTSYKKLKIK